MRGVQCFASQNVHERGGLGSFLDVSVLYVNQCILSAKIVSTLFAKWKDEFLSPSFVDLKPIWNASDSASFVVFKKAYLFRARRCSSNPPARCL